MSEIGWGVLESWRLCPTGRSMFKINHTAFIKSMVPVSKFDKWDLMNNVVLFLTFNFFIEEN